MTSRRDSDHLPAPHWAERLTSHSFVISMLLLGAVLAWIGAGYSASGAGCTSHGTGALNILFGVGAVALLIAMLLTRMGLLESIVITVITSAVAFGVLALADFSHCAN